MTDTASLLPPFPPRAEEPAGLVWGQFTSRAGAHIRWAQCAPPQDVAIKGHIVMLPGFKEPIEKCFEAMRDLHARGYAVWVMDWRGQGGSERYIPAEPHKAHHAGFDEQLADLHQFMTDHVRPAVAEGLPLHLMGHSMGGHLVLRYLHDHNQPGDDGTPAPVTSALLTAPMLDISTGALPRVMARQMANFAKAGNFLHRYVPGGKGWEVPAPPPPPKKKQKKAPPAADLPPINTTAPDLDTRTSALTSDPVRIAVQAHWFLRKPALALGDPTYGWVYHAFRSIDLLNQEAYLKAINTPVLMQISGDDRVVIKAASQRAAGLLPQCTRLDIPEARHEIWMERDELRDRWLTALDAFLQKGPAAAPAAKKSPPARRDGPPPAPRA